MPALINFSDYSVPSIDFGFANIYTIPVPQNQYSTVAAIATPTTPIVATKTISFVVQDANGTIPGANISVNGVPTAQTDTNGKVILPNIPANAAIVVSYIGYDNYEASALNIPAKVVLKEGAVPIDEVKIFTNPTTKSSSTWLWALLGIGAVYGAYKYSNSGTKVVKAKI